MAQVSPQVTSALVLQWSLHLHVRSMSTQEPWTVLHARSSVPTAIRANPQPRAARPDPVGRPSVRGGSALSLVGTGNHFPKPTKSPAPRESRVSVPSTTDTHISPHSCVCGCVMQSRVSSVCLERPCLAGVITVAPPRAPAACFNVYSCIERSMLPDGPLLLLVTRPPADEARLPLCSTPWPPPSSPSLRNS